MKLWYFFTPIDLRFVLLNRTTTCNYVEFECVVNIPHTKELTNTNCKLL